MNAPSQVDLLRSQLTRMVDLLKAENEALRTEVSMLRELTGTRLVAPEETAGHHEARLRIANDGVTQFKLFAGLASGGSSTLSIIALAKSLLGL
jgi:hypothetical protein